MMAIKFLGGVVMAFGVLCLLTFPIMIFMGIWSDGNIVHKYVGTGFLCLLFGLISFFFGWFLVEEG